MTPTKLPTESTRKFTTLSHLAKGHIHISAQLVTTETNNTEKSKVKNISGILPSLLLKCSKFNNEKGGVWLAAEKHQGWIFFVLNIQPYREWVSSVFGFPAGSSFGGFSDSSDNAT